MTRARILDEIRRTAKANGGVALGRLRIESQSGIRYCDWHGKYWSRWSEAVREAGLEPNRKSEASSDEFLLQKLIFLTRRLQRVPVEGDLRMEARNDSEFPSASVFSRLGSRSERVTKVLAYCGAKPEYESVGVLWKQAPTSGDQSQSEGTDSYAPAACGYVYLLRHGTRSEFKIGKTNNPLRREGELGIQLPEKLQPVHYIQTDDPSGVENYWHKRFADKRKEGEWFALTSEMFAHSSDGSAFTKSAFGCGSHFAGKQRATPAIEKVARVDPLAGGALSGLRTAGHVDAVIGKQHRIILTATGGAFPCAAGPDRGGGPEAL